MSLRFQADADLNSPARACDRFRVSGEGGRGVVRPSGGRYAPAIDESIEVGRGGSIAARARGRKTLPNGATWWQMPVFAHTSPVYLDLPGRPAPAAKSARLFLDQLHYLERWARQRNFTTEDNRRAALDLVRGNPSA